MKKLSLLIALSVSSFGGVFAHPHYVGGTYESSSEEGGVCTICCSRSELFCYKTSSLVQQNQPATYQLFDQMGPIDQSNYGSYMTFETLDANQNVIDTYKGYYYGMDVRTNQDGTKTSVIALDANPRN